jgi:hypothetical protein
MYMKKTIQTGKFRLFSGMAAGAALASLALAFIVGLSACPTEASPGGGGGLNKAALEASITAAQTEQAGTKTSGSNGADVPRGQQWVTLR